MFGFIYHIINFQRLSFYTWCNYKWTGEVSLPLVKRCKHEIINSGFVSIKLCQWSLPRLQLLYNLQDTEWYQELEKVYDNCYIHDNSYTKELYSMTMNKDFDLKYEIKEIVASGSIGQVYKVKDRETGQIKALKCKHPGINLQYRLSILVMRCMTFFLTLVERIHYRIFPVELETFYESLVSQVYLTNEADNMKKMYSNFEDNEYIIIPKFYEGNDDILVMDYVPGVKFQDLDTTYTSKYKVCFLLFAALRQMIVIDSIIHGDLHKGNWKVVIDTTTSKTKYKIVLYDMGYCFSVDNSRDNFEAVEENNIDKIVNIFPNIVNDVYNRPVKETRLVVRDDLFDNLVRPISNKHLVNNILKLCKKHGYIIDGYFISLAIILEQTACIFDDYLINQNAEVNNIKVTKNEAIYSEIMLKKDYPDLISYCDANKIFPELADYYRSRINNENLERKGIFEGCDFSSLIDPADALME